MKKQKKIYTPSKEEKELFIRENTRKNENSNVPAYAMPAPKFNYGYQSGFFEALLMMWAANRGFAASKVDVRGTWRADLNRYTKSGTTDGFPDIALCVAGYFVAIEVKGKGDKQRENQKAWQEKHEQAGGVYFIFSKIDDLKAIESKCLELIEKI